MYQRGARVNVFACQRGLLPTCLRANGPKAYKLIIFTWQNVNKGTNVSFAVPMFANVLKEVVMIQAFLLLNATRNFYTSLSKEKYYIILDILVLHICI